MTTKSKLALSTIKKALVRAVTNHGHDYFCSAARGMESDCHCGWTKIKALAKSFEPKSK